MKKILKTCTIVLVTVFAIGFAVHFWFENFSLKNAFEETIETEFGLDVTIGDLDIRS